MTTPTPLPYGTPDTPRIAVHGEAHLEVDPELARIAVTVHARGRDRRSTLADLTRRNTAALDLIRSYGDAIERLQTGTFTITPELTRKGREERVRTHYGTVHITAELTDHTALGELTTRLADLELTRVMDLRWALRPDSPAHRQARQQAVTAAVQRAREYADALGTTLTALVELADTGAEQPDRHRPRSGGAETRAIAYSGDPDDIPAPPLDLEPRRQHVHATVTARFTMAPPTL
ncbi:SIMPL domain-containing protein [Streptomyces sp. NPDC006997]|uniref:SIMPL domain-containing protein n=1 Tax=Streptomyces sp. NPDC006997 TaxID=3155356 RepID=UPI00340F5CE8